MTGWPGFAVTIAISLTLSIAVVLGLVAAFGEPKNPWGFIAGYGIGSFIVGGAIGLWREYWGWDR